MIAFQAVGASSQTVTRNTARQAAQDFFDKYPKARQCDVREGVEDGMFFSIRYGAGAGQRWNKITRKTVDTLPGADMTKLGDAS